MLNKGSGFGSFSFFLSFLLPSVALLSRASSLSNMELELQQRRIYAKLSLGVSCSVGFGFCVDLGRVSCLFALYLFLQLCRG